MAGLGKKRGALAEAKGKSSKRFKGNVAASSPLGRPERQDLRMMGRMPAAMINAFYDDESGRPATRPASSAEQRAAGNPVRSWSVSCTTDGGLTECCELARYYGDFAVLDIHGFANCLISYSTILQVLIRILPG